MDALNSFFRTRQWSFSEHCRKSEDFTQLTIGKNIMLDGRLIRIGIQVGGQMVYYTNADGMAMSASGAKYADPTKNKCAVQIANCRREVRDAILQRGQNALSVDVGRESGGLWQVFIGDITYVECSPPPDITLKITAATGADTEYKIVSRSFGGATMLSAIATGVAQDLEKNLKFEAKDRQLYNYYFNGPANTQLYRLEEAGVTVHVDDRDMLVQDKDKPIAGRIKILDKTSGMIGVPTVTDEGVKVRYLIDSPSVIGGLLRVDSEVNKAVNGDYIIDVLSFSASSHSDDFYYEAEGVKLDA